MFSEPSRHLGSSPGLRALQDEEVKSQSGHICGCGEHWNQPGQTGHRPTGTTVGRGDLSRRRSRCHLQPDPSLGQLGSLQSRLAQGCEPQSCSCKAQACGQEETGQLHTVTDAFSACLAVTPTISGKGRKRKLLESGMRTFKGGREGDTLRAELIRGGT